jgi:hypothetical protein
MRITLGIVLAALLGAGNVSAQALADQAPPPEPETSVVSSGPLLNEPGFLRRGIDFASPYMTESGHERGSGFYPKVGDMITGAGWIAAGPGVRLWLGNRAFVDAAAAVSWHTYKEAQVTFEVPRLAGGHVAVGSEVHWNDMTQVHYFGIGPDLPETDSEYRMKTVDVVGYTTYRPKTWLAIDGRAGWLAKPAISSGAGWFDADYADTRAVFLNDPAIGVQPPSYLHGEAAVTFDTRDFPSYPTQGSVFRASWSTFADRTHDAYSFQRYEAEAAQFFPVVKDRWTLAVHGWGVFTDIAADHAVPFFMLPSLGGGNTLRGDRNYRFHDRDMLLVNAESRFGLFEHMDAAIFMDAGNVAPEFSALNLDKRSYGAGIRFHTRTSTLARIDVAHGQEQGWRVMLKLHDALRMGRIDRHTAAVPFVP